MTIDADAVVARLYRPGQAGHEALVRTYGSEILLPDGQIDRRKLADIAFASTNATKKLNALIHPLVIDEEKRIISAEAARFPDRDRIVVAEATLLLESGGKQRYDKIVVVDNEPELQIERAVKRGMTRGDAKRRIAQQMPRQERLALADYVILNNGDPRALEVETYRVYEGLCADLEAKKKERR